MTITVDNQYDIYFGDQYLTTPTYAGGDGSWFVPETWSVTGVNPTDFLYVATASDHSVAQGFIGEFTNLTTTNMFVTSDDPGTPWEVFPAGNFLPALNALDPSIPAGVWPISVQPTMSQVQTAVTYATVNNLWITPTSVPGYDNGSSPSPWGAVSGISPGAEWIWYDSGLDPGGFIPAPFNGFNHAEFLVFRVPGVPGAVKMPEPASAVLSLLGAAGLALVARRRRAGCRSSR
jgi:hypothetical protein